MSSMYEILIQWNPRGAGHLSKLENSQIVRKILYSQHREGNHGIGRPNPHYKYKATIIQELNQKGSLQESWD